jgi:hypothetical protein
MATRNRLASIGHAQIQIVTPLAATDTGLAQDPTCIGNRIASVRVWMVDRAAPALHGALHGHHHRSVIGATPIDAAGYVIPLFPGTPSSPPLTTS